VTLTVDAAPWASWYAWVLYASGFLGVVFLYQRARISWSLDQKVSELEVLRAELEQANTRLDQLARLDGLTSIPNRRALDTWLAEEWSRAQRQRQSVCVLMLDIDDFKRYNDFYGHLAGDNCLRAVAQTMASHLHRNSDFCARYGGEEFVVILHDTELEGGVTVAQRLSESIDQLALPHLMSSAQKFVTVSIGVASQVPGIEHSVDDLLRRADQALYRAKALGRHKIESSTPLS
jgi:diguanylate cyclase (GGDEF)-like protein